MAWYPLLLSFGALCLVYKVCWFFFRRYIISRTTALDDLDDIGRIRAHPKLRGTVVICGGSISGLLAARVCSDHFQDVVMVEAEDWITTPSGYIGSHRKELAPHKRSHVAQYKAAHIYQPFLVTALLRWFPNFIGECQRLGGRVLPYKPSISLAGKFFATPTYPDFVPPSMNISRPGFETLLRKLVLTSCPNVRYVSGTVTGLIQAQSSNAIAGVRIRNTGEESILLASLIIGPASAGLRWLKELAKANGNQKASTQLENLRVTYNPKLSYRTCEFNVPPHVTEQLKEAGFPEDWNTTTVPLVCFPDAKVGQRLLAVVRKDNDYLEYLCGGWEVSDKISTIQDVKMYISNMDSELTEPLPTWVTAVLNVLEANNVPMRVEYSRLGKVSVVVDRLCTVSFMRGCAFKLYRFGDSVMIVNPVRGVGCTKASVEALTLNKLLFGCVPDPRSEKIDPLPNNFSKRYFELLAQRTGHEWDVYKAEDYAWKTTIPAKGDDLSFGKFHRAFGDLLVELLYQDSDAMWTFNLVRGWIAPATDFLAPNILMKLIWMKLRSAMRKR
ncbi:hypothetical protein Clacol_006987 [Clathrus columnatus]|uniref:Uncharacterized protein n=1 Tax=Clathrus columnatus TaxID=1419009 RepID=A0AAV5AG99_9AGAM|nr:hypothetical protein Clacol_006987 [Clathrus columnatus]